MPKETRKIWARTETAKGLSRAVAELAYAAGSSTALPATFRRRLQRLTEQVAKLREDIRSWPVTQDERLLKERTGTFYGDQDYGSDVEDVYVGDPEKDEWVCSVDHVISPGRMELDARWDSEDRRWYHQQMGFPCEYPLHMRKKR